MFTFLIYEAKVAAALLVFYLFYRFLLKKETFHRLNRVVLVGTAVLSFLLPLCIITVHDAFVAVREDLAMGTYGQPYAKLEMAQQDELLEKCRVRIYETGK